MLSWQKISGTPQPNEPAAKRHSCSFAPLAQGRRKAHRQCQVVPVSIFRSTTGSHRCALPRPTTVSHPNLTCGFKTQASQRQILRQMASGTVWVRVSLEMDSLLPSA